MNTIRDLEKLEIDIAIVRADVMTLQADLATARQALAEIHRYIEVELDPEYVGVWSDYYASTEIIEFVDEVQEEAQPGQLERRRGHR